jgi:arylsulfatase/uncharacterized sulfatase
VAALQFNFARDPGETTDLSAREPAVKARLLLAYAAYARRVGVLPMPDDYDSAKQIARNTGARLLGNYPWLYAVFSAILLLPAVGIGLGLRALVRRKRSLQ